MLFLRQKNGENSAISGASLSHIPNGGTVRNAEVSPPRGRPNSKISTWSEQKTSVIHWRLIEDELADNNSNNNPNSLPTTSDSTWFNCKPHQRSSTHGQMVGDRHDRCSKRWHSKHQIISNSWIFTSPNCLAIETGTGLSACEAPQWEAHMAKSVVWSGRVFLHCSLSSWVLSILFLSLSFSVFLLICIKKWTVAQDFTFLSLFLFFSFFLFFIYFSFFSIFSSRVSWPHQIPGSEWPPRPSPGDHRCKQITQHTKSQILRHVNMCKHITKHKSPQDTRVESLYSRQDMSLDDALGIPTSKVWSGGRTLSRYPERERKE